MSTAHEARETFIHSHMARAGLAAARDWDRMTPGEYHAAALTDLCRARGLQLSSGCGFRNCAISKVPALQPVECDSEGGEAD